LGAAAAIFMTSTAALVDPLPYARSDRLVHLWEARTGSSDRSPTSYPTLLDWRTRSRSFSALEGYDPANVTVGVGDGARMLRGAQVTSGFFRLLGVPMSAGRDFLDGEDRSGSAVAIVSESFARSVGGLALDQVITINGVPHTVVGVLPNAFHFALLQDAQVFMPLLDSEQRRADRFDRSVHLVGRLRNDVRLSAARSELTTIMSELGGENREALAGRTVAAASLRDALLGPVKPILTGLAVAVVILLGAMCANLALLMLTRYVERIPELRMRFALGATRPRILRQLMVESLAPALAGALLALVIGQLTTRALLSTIPAGVRIAMPYLADVGLDARAVALVVILALVLAIGFGLGPALRVTKVSARAGDARATSGHGDRRIRRTLVGAQMTFSVVLLVASGLLVVSFSKLVHHDIGVRDPASIAMARVPLSGLRYEDPVAPRRFYETLVARVASVPGVSDASLINEVPGGGGGMTTFDLAEHARPRSMQPSTAVRIVGSDYFRTMGISVVAGRSLESGDRADAPLAAVLSASAAKLLRAEGAATLVGTKVRLAATGRGDWTIVGIVGDVQVAALDAESPPVVYLSHLQAPENRLTLVLRTRLAPVALAAEVRAIVESLDRGIPVFAISTLSEQLSSSKAVFIRRFPMILCGVFGAAALALTLVAVYAMCMHEVTTRRREFGIRLAVGGTPGAIRRLIVGDAITLGATGVGTGAVLAALVSESLRSLLFGVTAMDWRVYVIVVASVFVSAVVTTLRPAYRASRVQPSIVLRGE
jgi:predicted permease